jgi:hypothetical protein
MTEQETAKTLANIDAKILDFNKLVSIIGFIFLVLSLTVIIRTPSTTGYEISIYAMYPVYFWGLIISSTICGIFVIFYNAFSERIQYKWVIIGFIIVVISNLIVTYLPIFRGYYINDIYDEISHLGAIKEIYLDGHFTTEDFYPASHIFVYQIAAVLGLGTEFIIKFVPSIFYLVYMLGVLLLSRVLVKRAGAAVLVLAFASPLLFTYFNYAFLPTHFSLFLAPMLICLFFSGHLEHGLKYRIVFILYLSVMPFVHPLGSLLIMALFLLFAFSVKSNQMILKKLNSKNMDEAWNLRSTIFPAAVLFVILFFWFSKFDYFGMLVNQAVSWLFSQSGETALEITSRQLMEANFSISQFLRVLIINYGQVLIFAGLTILSVALTLRNIFIKKNEPNLEVIFTSIVFVIITLFYMSTLVGNFLQTGRSIRIFCWALMAGLFLNGSVLFNIITNLKKRSKTIATVLLFFILVISSGMGVFNVYFSPAIFQGDIQGTEAYYDGMAWFYEEKAYMPIIYLNECTWRISSMIYGTTYQPSGKFIKSLPHLGYANASTLAQSYEGNSYFIISKRDRVIKDVNLSSSIVYTSQDLAQLDNDSSMSLIYYNGDAEIWEIIH